jgi:hypothetical protein
VYQSVVSKHRLLLCAFLIWSSCNKAQFIDPNLLMLTPFHRISATQKIVIISNFCICLPVGPPAAAAL